MAREAIKENVLDSLQLLSEVSAYLKGFDEGRNDMLYTIRHINERFNDFGGIGKIENIIKLRNEIIQHFGS